jgi:type VI secretion system ImpA family protein
MQAIQRVSFFPEGPYHYAAYVAAKVFQSLPSDEQTQLQDIGVPLLGDFDAAVNECSIDQINAYLSQIEAAVTAAEVVDRQLRAASEALRAAEAKKRADERQLAGDSQPVEERKLSDERMFSMSKVLEQLRSVHSWFKHLAAERLQAASPQAQGNKLAVVAQQSTGGVGFGGGVATGDSPHAALRSREEALNSLLKVAAFFRSTEPHSPLSYALEQAVRWGKMPLPDLLRDLVRDDEVLVEVYRRMGIQENGEKDGHV